MRHWKTLRNPRATGATAKNVNVPAVQRVNDWLLDLPSPQYPFPVEAKLASAGKVIFDRDCASCHAFGSARVGKLIPLAEVGTDPNRANHWTKQATDEFNVHFDKYSWGEDHFQGSTGGYVALALGGVWARAPYLHNGSVPTLQDLLTPPESRPKTFFRNDVYDPIGVGFVTEAPSRGGRDFSKFDTALPGNGNTRHSYETTLPPKDKTALIEYLKTF